MRAPLAIALILAAAAPAVARDKAPVGHVTGPAVDCINRNQIRDTVRPDDRTIFFRVGSNRWYRNDLPQSCPRLDDLGTAISYKVTTGQLCSVDIVNIVDTTSGIGTLGACGLGKFTPFERDKTANK